MIRDPDADPAALMCIVGSTELRYHLRAVEDLRAMLIERGDWVPLGSADERRILQRSWGSHAHTQNLRFVIDEGEPQFRFGILECGQGADDRSLIVARHSLWDVISENSEDWQAGMEESKHAT